MNSIKFDKTYLLTRIYQSLEHENQILSACLEPVFTSSKVEVFEENLNMIVMLNQDNAGDLLNFLSNSSDEGFVDGIFVQVINKSERMAFKIANDTPEAQSIIEEYNRLTEEIRVANEL